MKKFIGMTVLAAAMLVPVASFAAPAVYFVPADQGVATSTAGSVQVWVSGTTVGSFDLNIHASNSNLTWVDAMYPAGAPLGSPASGDPSDPSSTCYTDLSINVCFGSVVTGQSIDVQGFSWLSSDPAELPAVQSDPSFMLFTLDFTTGAANGPTELTFASYGGSPKLGTNITNWDGVYQADASFGSACVRVGDSAACGQTNPAPEPASYALVAIGLLAAGVAGRARRRAGASPAAA
jgi:hypothetical protein